MNAELLTQMLRQQFMDGLNLGLSISLLINGIGWGIVIWKVRIQQRNSEKE